LRAKGGAELRFFFLILGSRKVLEVIILGGFCYSSMVGKCLSAQMSRKALANLSVVFDRLGWKVGNTRINQPRGTLSILYHREEFLYAFRSTVPRRQIHDSLVINPQNLIG
jgi:hypothetical protein